MAHTERRWRGRCSQCGHIYDLYAYGDERPALDKSLFYDQPCVHCPGTATMYRVAARIDELIAELDISA